MSLLFLSSEGSCFKFQSDSINPFISSSLIVCLKYFKFQSDSINPHGLVDFIIIRAFFKFQSDSINPELWRTAAFYIMGFKFQSDSINPLKLRHENDKLYPLNSNLILLIRREIKVIFDNDSFKFQSDSINPTNGRRAGNLGEQL